MAIIKANAASEAGEMPSAQMLTEMTAYNEKLVTAGVMQAGDGLHPSSKGARVTFSGDKRAVVHGPFAETNELIAGFWIWKVDSLDEAIEWAKRCPNPTGEDGEIELRQLFELDDFNDQLTPETRAANDRLSEALSARGA